MAFLTGCVDCFGKSIGKPFRWLALACAIVIICLMAAGRASTHPAQAISSDAFWQQVDETIAWLSSHPSATSAEWQAEASRWEKIRAVSLPGQPAAQVEVDTSYIVHLLRANPPDRASLSAYLTALKQSRSLTTTAGSGTGERETKILADILAKPEFQYDPHMQNPLQKFLQWLSDQYARLLELLFGNADINIGIPAEISIPITLLVIAAILAFVFRDTLRNLFREVELAEETPGEGEILSSQFASQKARELSRGGDYRHALRYLYLSALLHLDERGLLRYNRAQTNREYIRQVSGRPELAEQLRVVVETFDRVWYGCQPMDAASYARYAETVTALEETRE